MTSLQYIAGRVSALVKKYDTRDPFSICKSMDIHIRYKDLGYGIKAFYFYQSRIKNIVINNRVEQEFRRILCAHELGHAVLHGKLAAVRGFQEFNLFDSVVPTEYEANLFAAELLIDDGELKALLKGGETSFFALAQKLRVPAPLLDFKFRVLQSKGVPVTPPVYSRSDFLKDDVDGCFSS